MTATVSGAAKPDYPGRDVWGAFIGGAFAEVGDAETFAVMEPATGRQIARVVSDGPGLVDRAAASLRPARSAGRAAMPCALTCPIVTRASTITRGSPIRCTARSWTRAPLRPG